MTENIMYDTSLPTLFLRELKNFVKRSLLEISEHWFWALFVTLQGRGQKKFFFGGGRTFFFALPSYEILGGRQNFNCKFKTFGFLDTLKVHTKQYTYTVQLPCKYYFISPSNKTSRKKQQTIFFKFFALQFQILKVWNLWALGGVLPFCPPLVLKQYFQKLNF